MNSRENNAKYGLFMRDAWKNMKMRCIPIVSYHIKVSGELTEQISHN
jgi:hypothetical protein